MKKTEPIFFPFGFKFTQTHIYIHGKNADFSNIIKHQRHTEKEPKNKQTKNKQTNKNRKRGYYNIAMGQFAKKAHFISGMLIFGTCTSILMKVTKKNKNPLPLSLTLTPFFL